MKKLVILILLLFSVTGFAEGNLSVVFFDIGSADSMLITANDSAVLIDTGKNKDGEKILDYLADNGISRLDALIITHFDKDHVGGADKLIAGVEIGAVIEPDYAEDSKQYRQYKEALVSAGISPMRLTGNHSFELGGATYSIDVAQPDSGYQANDMSLVISAEFGDTRFLFAGDAENPRLAELLGAGIGRYDVLKVPHHGVYERLSAPFFEAVAPRYAVITSSNEDPEEQLTVSALTFIGTQVYLTRNGQVTMCSDGSKITVSQ